MADRNSLANLHTHQELENAKTKGQIIGWIQGAGAAVLVWFLLGLVGWIPLLAIAGVVGYLVYRFLFRGHKE